MAVMGIARRCRGLAAAAGRPGAGYLMRDMAGASARGRWGAAWRMARTAARGPDLGAEKVVSREYRYIWLCVPKAASRSIRDALLGVTPDAEVFVGKSIAEVLALRPAARDYYSFAFVRHPYTRALSFYAELYFAGGRYGDTEQGRHKAEKAGRFFERFYGLSPDLGNAAGFDGYCRWLNTAYASDAVADRHFLSQYLQIELGGGRLPDFVGRLEGLDDDFGRVARDVGLPQVDLPLLNTMAGWAPGADSLRAARDGMGGCLTAGNRELLARRYARDLALGGYSAE